jgi:4-azaleucine resistance transporter AzlC
MNNPLKALWSKEHKRDGFLLGVAVGSFGVTFGVLAISAGLSGPKAAVMSLVVFTGASQFAAVGIVNSGGEPISALGTALLLSARNGAYALSLSQVMPNKLSRRLLAAQLVIDESAAMSKAQSNLQDAKEAFWVTGLSVFFFWNAGTLVGILLGEVVGDPLVWGLDAAFPAAFVALLLPHIKERGKRRAAILGAGVALLTIPLVPSGVPVVLAASSAAIVSWGESRR